ncbi:hypothetical protein MC885_019025 [Smutsia gigantea]|nr:hypothetical protein MC885_019025 [Smutsia gigantea]
MLEPFHGLHGNNTARDTYESKVPSYYWPTFLDCHLLREPWIWAKYKQRREFTHTETQEPYSAGQVEWKEAPPQHCQVPGVGLHGVLQGFTRAEVALGSPCSCLPPWDRTRPLGNLASGPWILVLELRSPGPSQGPAGQSPAPAQSLGPMRSCHQVARSPCREHPHIAWTSDCRAKEPKASMKSEHLNATFQPAQIGHPHGLQVTYLKDNSTRNMFVCHEDGKDSRGQPGVPAKPGVAYGGPEDASSKPSVSLSTPDIMPLPSTIHRLQPRGREQVATRLVLEPIPGAPVSVIFLELSGHLVELCHGDLLCLGLYYLLLFKDPVQAQPMPAQALATSGLRRPAAG